MIRFLFFKVQFNLVEISMKTLTLLNPTFCTHDKAMTKLYLFIYTLNKHNTFVVGKGIHNGKKQFTFETLLSFYLWAPRISYRPNYMTLLAYNVLKLT